MKGFISASCPANTFLIGEFAILYGYLAAVMSINKRLSVKLTPGNGFGVSSPVSKGAPVQRTVKFLAERFGFKPDFELSITSEIPPRVGLGSSDACIVATTGAVLQHLGIKLTKLKLLDLCHEIRSSMEKCSKGALSAAIYGNITILDNHKLKTVTAAKQRVYTFVFTGSHKTNSVVPFLQRFEKQPKLYHECIKQMGALSKQLVKNIDEPDPELLNRYQELMRAIGASNAFTDQFVSKLLEKGALGAKLSGGGRGDGAICIAPRGFYKKMDTLAFEIVNDDRGLTVSEV